MTTDKPYWEQDIVECLRIAADAVGKNSYYLRAAEYIEELRAEKRAAISTEALLSLKNAQQADADGVMVRVSRQALEEAIAVLSIRGPIYAELMGDASTRLTMGRKALDTAQRANAACLCANKIRRTCKRNTTFIKSGRNDLVLTTLPVTEQFSRSESPPGEPASPPGHFKLERIGARTSKGILHGQPDSRRSEKSPSPVFTDANRSR